MKYNLGNSKDEMDDLASWQCGTGDIDLTTWHCGLKKLTSGLDKLMKNGNGFSTWQIGHTKMNVV